ncbi:hypothetical protein L1987_43331 [Smallanthus sonchifolius]|uniref:Uncharacterized protein n=1 Tax=Smallanthus sonchifolius TaxID=185202 RepID=A0ACB9GM11_9ASTR|nr:hypothetical protein L1987_43331 [Smallanthus sonchifolius]
MLIQFLDHLYILDATTSDSVNDGKEVLNIEEYAKMFPCTVSRKNDPNLRYEASRASLDKWMELFPSIISRAETLQIYDELQMLSLPICCANKRNSFPSLLHLKV